MFRQQAQSRIGGDWHQGVSGDQGRTPDVPGDPRAGLLDVREADHRVAW